MSTNTGKRNIFVDIFRYLLTLLVMGVHFGDGVFLPLFRLGVPAFFVISGFYNRADLPEKQQRKNISFVRNSLLYLVFAMVVYILYDFVMALYWGASVNDFFVSLFRERFIYYFFHVNEPVTSGYHLWYLVALFVLSVVHYIACKLRLDKYYRVVAVVLLVVSLTFGGYLHVFVDYSLETHDLRNTWFMAFPLFALGYVLRGERQGATADKSETICCLVMGCVFALLAYAERVIVEMEFYLSDVLSAAFFIVGLDGLGKLYPQASQGRAGRIVYEFLGKDATYYMYVFHLIVGSLACGITHRNYLLMPITFFGSLALYLALRYGVKGVNILLRKENKL